MNPARTVRLLACRDDEEAARRARPPQDDVLDLPFVHPEAAIVARAVAKDLGVACHDIGAVSGDLGIAGPPDGRAQRQAGETDGQPVVLALAGEAGFDARRFAAATSRVMMMRDAADVNARTWTELSGASSVTVVCPRTWSTADLERLRTTHREVPGAPPLGFLHPFGHAVRETALLKTILNAWAGVHGGDYRLAYPLDADDGIVRAGNAEVRLGPGGTSAELEEWLAGPADFLFATPHSNGVDLSLGPVVLCSRLEQDVEAPAPTRALPCFGGAECTRVRPGIVAVPVSRVNTTVACWYTCWGVMLSDGVYDPSTCLAHRVAAAVRPTALVTTPGLSLLDRAAGLYLAELLRSGKALGPAVDEVNRAHWDRYRDTAEVFILLGDPELRLSRGPALAPALLAEPAFARFADRTGLRPYGVVAGPSAEPGDEAIGWEDGLDMARCTAQGSTRLPTRAVVETARHLGRSTDDAWAAWTAHRARAQGPARRGSYPYASLTRWHLAWLDYAEALFGTLGGYLRLQIDRFYIRGESGPRDQGCPYCGQPAAEAPMRLPERGRPSRVLVECAACATVADGVPPLATAVARVREAPVPGGTLALTLEWDPAVSGRVSSVAVLEPFAKRGDDVHVACSRTEFRLPKEPGRLVLPGLEVPERTPFGVHHLNVLLLVGTYPVVLRQHLVVSAPLVQPDH